MKNSDMTHGVDRHLVHFHAVRIWSRRGCEGEVFRFSWCTAPVPGEIDSLCLCVICFL